LYSGWFSLLEIAQQHSANGASVVTACMGATNGEAAPFINLAMVINDEMITDVCKAFIVHVLVLNLARAVAEGKGGMMDDDRVKDIW
jgi:hypothetical protein